MGVKYMGPSELREPMKCAWCGAMTIDLVKVRSHEDAKTLRICRKHWNQLAVYPKEWDAFVAIHFPKWGVKVMGKEWYKERDLVDLLDKKPKKKGAKRCKATTTKTT